MFHKVSSLTEIKEPKTFHKRWDETMLGKINGTKFFCILSNSSSVGTKESSLI